MAVSPRILFALKVGLGALIVIQSCLLIIVLTLLQVPHAVPVVLVTGIIVDVMFLTIVVRLSRGQGIQ